jgi:hypothetical protein
LKRYKHKVYKSLFWRTIIIFKVVSLIAFARLPRYAVKLAENFNVPVWIATTWSFAESTHNTQKISSKKAYGRYQIRYILFKHYCQLTGRNIDNIKDHKRYLLDDRNNCFIAYYFYDFWVHRKGYTPKQFMQIWLMGIRNYHSGRYSKSFERKIFGQEIVFK